MKINQEILFHFTWKSICLETLSFFLHFHFYDSRPSASSSSRLKIDEVSHPLICLLSTGQSSRQPSVQPTCQRTAQPHFQPTSITTIIPSSLPPGIYYGQPT